MKKIILITLMFYNLLAFGKVYSDNITDEISNEILRMHIIANSNEEYDQKIKFEVRDLILGYVNENDLNTKEDVVKNVGNLKSEINSYLLTNNVDYSAKVLFGNSIFGTKIYNNISIPAGEYNSIKVILGNGDGENWWCVAYPPLCFTEKVSGEITDDGEKKLKGTLNNEAYNLIKKENVEYKIKFKTVEIFNSIFKKS